MTRTTTSTVHRSRKTCQLRSARYLTRLRATAKRSSSPGRRPSALLDRDGEDCTRACNSERAHVHEEQCRSSRDGRRPGKGRHVEPRCAKEPFARGLACALAIGPDCRDHAKRRGDGAADDESNDPRRSTLRTSGLLTSEAGEQQDEPRQRCECDSRERGVLRSCSPARSLRHTVTMTRRDVPKTAI